MKNASKQLTKQDVKDAVKSALINFTTKDDLNSLEKRIGDRFATKEDLITFKDEILKEIKAMREEVAVVGVSRDMVEDHEVRIETIEKHLHIQPPS